MKVMVVGGPKSLVYGNFGRKLQEHGVTVDSHLAYKDGNSHRTLGRIPKSCAGVIIIADMVSHATCGAAKTAAARQKLLCVEVPRKFSQAEPFLRQNGFLPTNSPITIGLFVAAPETTPLNGITVPSRSFLKARASTPSPPVLATVSPAVEVAQRVAEADRATALLVAEIEETTETLLQLQPELLLDEESLVAEVVSIGAWGLVSCNLRGIVITAAHKLRAKWAFDRTQPKNAADQTEKHKATEEWLFRVWQDYVDGKRPYPDAMSLKTEARTIFSTAPAWYVVQEVRTKVLGLWAEDLVSAGQLARLYEVQIPNFMELVESGSIRSVGSKNRKLTSKLAVQDYLAAVPSPALDSPLTATLLGAPEETAKLEALVDARVRERVAELEARLLSQVKAALTAALAALSKPAT